MGNQIDWAGIEIIAELLGVEDLEWLLDQLTVIRDYQRRMADVESQRFKRAVR
jgi:hypothetical protein